MFAPVAGLIGAADLAICHLETPVDPDGGPYRGYPSFAVQPEMDRLDAAGIAHTGTYRSEADRSRPTLVDAGGVTVGVVTATYGLNGAPPPRGREWSVDVAAVPEVDDVLAAAARARAAGAEIVVASLHCCVEYRHDPTPVQVAAVRTLLASPDVDLVLGHHAHVVQPFEQIAGEWVAYGLGNHLAEHATRGYPTEDSVAARFIFTRGADGRFAVSRAEAVPLAIEVGTGAVTVRPADPATYDRVAAVLDRRGAVAAGLAVLPG